MKKLIVCLMTIAGSAPLMAQQTEVKTLANGVQVHQAKGNEERLPEVVAPEVRTINDWNLSECIDALTAIDGKIAMVVDPVRLAKLTEYRAEVNARKELLLNPSK